MVTHKKSLATHLWVSDPLFWSQWSRSFSHVLNVLYGSLVQNLVNKMWVGVASEEKAELRSCLPKLLLSQHAVLPFFIRNKLCKVIVDIGRQDWPMFYHDFFSNTLQVGLIMLGLCEGYTADTDIWCKSPVNLQHFFFF